MFAVRHSKFKNIYGDPKKKEQCFDQIKLKVKGSEPPLAAVNAKYLAVLINCSTVDIMIRPLGEVGRVEADPKGIKAATSLPTCIEWCTRDDDLLLIGQQSGEINLIRIPDEGVTEPISTDDAEVKWNCESGSILSAVWHPTVGNAVLTSCGSKFAGAGSSADTHLIMWDTVKLEKLVDIQLNNCYLTSLSFNFNGSKVVCTDNLHVTRVIDLRADSPISQEAMLHKKARRQNTVYLKNGLIFSTGYSMTTSREYGLWDENDLSNPIELVDMDTNSGVLYPIYDADINVIYVWGKGDSNMSFFEVVHDPKPNIQYLCGYQSTKPQSGVISMPKLGVNVSANELTRIFKFYANGFCEVIPILCMRRELGFSEDIYPPTPGREPALTVDEWVNGADADPILVSLDTGEACAASSNIANSLQKQKSPQQKINEIMGIISDFTKTGAIEDRTLSDHRQLLHDIRMALEIVTESNGPDHSTDKAALSVSGSEKQFKNSLHQYESEKEKAGLLRAVDAFVKSEVPESPDMQHCDAEWND